ncbi:MAG: threonylcarbamoyl-AMP synthase [Alloprevotella sp.]|nr:threonylcarbamoyl-AMP synthase [Alloprevotella sp.]MBR1651928.1 threonylcarbamoyl-AMP synthase [Alloprevotella sp.]
MLVKLYNSNNSPKQIERIARLLEDGGVIIVPTDTTYALACHALKERAVERVCQIRGITPREHPLSIVCYDLSAISEFAHISTPVFKMMKRNLPGAFTFLLPGKGSLPKVFHARPQREVGIRMPDVPPLRELLERLQAPLLTLSLPADGLDAEYRTSPELVEEAFGDRVDLVISGGEGLNDHSTIVDCTGDEPEILRQGMGELS